MTRIGFGATTTASMTTKLGFMLASLAVLLTAPSSSVDALASVGRPTTTTRRAAAKATVSSSTQTIEPVAVAGPATTPSLATAPPPAQKGYRPRLEDYEYALEYDEDESVDDDDDDVVDRQSLSDFQLFQQSTGSEILQAELQAQIDAASNQPDMFVDKQDASLLEKIAMSSVTEQLPQRAVKALQQQQLRSAQQDEAEGDVIGSKALKDNRKAAKQRNDLNFSTKRVSHEREIALSRTIQRGVALLNIQKEMYDELDGRMPTKQEWAMKAGLTTNELRRQISDYRTAKHELVTANIGLVHAVVKQQYNQHYRNSGLTFEELVQEGSLGLLRAAELFDPSRGLRFSTYAVVWIKGTLSNTHLPELVKLPGREKTKFNKIVKAQRDLKESGETPNFEKIAQVTGMSVEQVMVTQRRMDQAQRVLSLDYSTVTQSRSGMESGSLNDFLEKDKSLQADVDLAERTQMHADILAALTSSLDEREARLMRLRYGLSDGHARSLHECADAMGVSYTRVHQLATRCLKKLRQAAEMEALEEYLLTIA